MVMEKLRPYNKSRLNYGHLCMHGEVTMINSGDILTMIQRTIREWHEANEGRPYDTEIVTDRIRRIRQFGEHREELEPVITELTETNTEMWHEEDKIRSEKDEVVLRAIRNVNPLNQHRNDLIEEIDEIFLEMADRRFTDGNCGQPD